MPNALLFPAAALFGLVILGPAHASSECTCRYKGGETTDGQTICMTTAKGRELAVCEKVLNVTSWKFLGQPCPSAVNDGQQVPMPPVSNYSSG